MRNDAPRVVGWMLNAICAMVMLTAHTAALAASAQEAAATGRWFAEYAPNPQAPVQRFIMQRNPDGTFTLQSRMYAQGKMVGELRNAGLWGISNGLFFTVTTEVNGQKTDTKNPETVNPYLVRTLDKQRFVYQHIPTGTVLSARPVDAAFQLPN